MPLSVFEPPRARAESPQRRTEHPQPQTERSQPEIETPQPQTPVKSRRGYRVKNDLFSYNGVERAPMDCLRSLLNPVRIERERGLEQYNAGVHREEGFMLKKSWVCAQLKLFGQPCPVHTSNEDLVERLWRAIWTGACDVVPSHLVQLERDLKREYVGPYAEYKRNMREWLKNRKHQRLRAYQTAKEPSNKACLDLERFLSELFLNEAGEPDRAKTHEPLELTGIDLARVEARARQVKHLHAAMCGSVADRTLVIGWNIDTVSSVVERIGFCSARSTGLGTIFEVQPLEDDSDQNISLDSASAARSNTGSED